MEYLTHDTEMNITGLDVMVEISYYIDINKHAYGTDPVAGYQVESIEVIDYYGASVDERVAIEVAIYANYDEYHKHDIKEKVIDILTKEYGEAY